MRRDGLLGWGLAALAGVLASVGLWLVTANPTVHTAGDPEWTCYAPYDTVLHHQHITGMPNDWIAVDAACRHSARARFRAGVAAGTTGGIVALPAGALILRSRRRPRAAAPQQATGW